MDWKGIVLILVGIGFVVYQYQSNKPINLGNDSKIDKLGFDHKKRGYVYRVILIIPGVILTIRLKYKVQINDSLDLARPT